MFRKLTSVAVLTVFANVVFVSLTLADTVQWQGSTSEPGAWEAVSNWTSNPNLPTITDTVRCYTTGGTGAQITINSAGVAFAQKWQMKSGTTKLTINSGATFTNSDGVEMFMGTTSRVDIMANGLWNACTSIGSEGFSLSTQNAGNNTVNVWGTLNVDGTNNPTLKIGTTTNVNGYGTMNIYGGGVVYADHYNVGDRGVINMWNGGVFKIKGDVTTQTNLDIGTKIVGQGGAELETHYVAGENTTYVTPEPATLALLGLGCLALLRNRK